MNAHLGENRILVVDDDRRLRDLLVRFLEESGYQPFPASNAAEARAHLSTQGFEAIILDIMMPGEDGLSLTEFIHANFTTPILLLTARDSLDDRVQGLEKGADDYLSKPFEPRELLARIKAILRRQNQPIQNQSQDILHFGDYQFCPKTDSLKHGEEPIFLTSTEQTLLKTLALSPNKPFSREDLAQRIGHRVSERTVDVQITRLRRKIGDDPRQPRYIQTVRHIGYVLKPEQAEQ